VFASGEGAVVSQFMSGREYGELGLGTPGIGDPVDINTFEIRDSAIGNKSKWKDSTSTTTANLLNLSSCALAASFSSLMEHCLTM
jgi:hypothetical protein